MAPVVLAHIYKQFPHRSKNSSSFVLSGPTEPSDPFHAPSPSSASPIVPDPHTTSSPPHVISVLRDINLTVRDGEFMVLVGPSGCGKSTLLRLIAGLESVTAGTIQVGDRPVNDLPPKERDIAMVFQNYALYPHMTVYDNLAFGLRRIGHTEPSIHRQEVSETAHSPNDHSFGETSRPLMSWRQRLDPVLTMVTRSLPRSWRYESSEEKAIGQRVQSVAEMLQIETLLDRLPRQLSGGQKQRVALGRAMARNPQVFLMDEPLSNLDAKLRLETRAQIVSLQRRLGITTIYVTHDQTEAMTMGDRIAVMNQGQIQQVAAPLDLYHHPANRFVAEFIGSVPMNFLTVRVNTPRLVTHPAFRLTLSDRWEEQLRTYEGRSLLLGIRPEHLQISVPAPKNIATVVERVETLGSDTFITARLTDVDALNPVILQARIQPDYPIALRDEIWLSLTTAKIHLFDPSTNRSLEPVN